MTENPINKEDGVWTDSFTESYIEIAEDDECCNMSTLKTFVVLTLISTLVIGGICYVAIAS